MCLQLAEAGEEEIAAVVMLEPEVQVAGLGCGVFHTGSGGQNGTSFGAGAGGAGSKNGGASGGTGGKSAVIIIFTYP